MQLDAAPTTATQQQRRGVDVPFIFRRLSARLVIYLLLAVVALIAVIPFLWMVATSLKTVDEAGAYPPAILPAVPQWHDFADSPVARRCS